MIGKRKLPFLLLGLGIGILLTNFIYYMIPKVEYVNLTDDEIIEKAKELGMVFVKDTIVVDNSVEEENPQKNLHNEEAIEKDLEEVVFQIEQGQSLVSISNNLYSAGVIDDIDGFINYAKERGMSTFFRVGTYNLSIDMDYETIVAILTKRDQ